MELPGIVDQLRSNKMMAKEKIALIELICQTLNPFSYPAKDRSRRLSVIEEPHLGKLMTKIKSEAKPIAEHLQYSNFNNSDNQASYDLIPNNTLAKVRMQIRPGGHDDSNQGWSGGYATKNQNTGSIYLSCEFVVLEGEFARRKIWSLIDLHSEKGPEWANIGRSFVKAILNSARGEPNLKLAKKPKMMMVRMRSNLP